MDTKIIIVTIKPWNIENALRLNKKYSKKYNILIIRKRDDFTSSCIEEFNPRYIFFPHWSWFIPAKIYKNYECIVFHMTDLPFGRGGSPLQNLILRGITKTKISAIRVIEKLDSGPVYLKRSLSLDGSAEEIYKRASKIIFDKMIPYIIEKESIPLPQKGKVAIFKRKTPQDSRIPKNIDLNGIYNYIRMLDADGYPSAFIETTNLRFEFTRTIRKNNSIWANVSIKKKENK